VEALWIRPADALEAGKRDEMLLVFPTIKNLEQLTGFESVDHALESVRGRDVSPVQPRVVVTEGKPQIFLPGERGYED
jgi:hypothetical protein